MLNLPADVFVEFARDLKTKWLQQVRYSCYSYVHKFIIFKTLRKRNISLISVIWYLCALQYILNCKFAFFISDKIAHGKKRCLTLEEALEYFHEIDDDDISESSSTEVTEQPDFVIIPPDPDELTDEEDIDDDVLGENLELPKDITGEIEVISKKCRRKQYAKKKENILWEKCTPVFNRKPLDLHSIESKKKESISNKLVNHEPVDMFLEIFSEDLLKHIVEESIKYAHQKNRLNFSLSVPLLKRFIGCLLFTGYSCLPQEKLYWSLADDVSSPLVRNAMTRSTYMSIKQNLHLADNTALDKTDKLAKVRPYIRILNENFLKYGVFSTHLSVDEQMIPYFGKHSCKMFMKGKPVRFGFKVWCLCSSSGYLFQFDIYTGKIAESKTEPLDLGLGSHVVTKLLTAVEVPSNHLIYFDNFFTSHSLLTKLTSMGFYATGTVRENRIGKCPLQPVKKIKREARGTYDSAFDKKNEICAVRWNDNAVVTVASNWEAVEPITTAKRYSRGEKKHVIIKQPILISDYNKHMGGVDLLDNFVAMYRVKVRGKKWWFPIFTNFIDVAKANAWRLYRDIMDSKISLLDFQRSIAVSLMKTPEEMQTDINLPTVSHVGRPSSVQKAILNVTRRDHLDHIIIKNDENKRKRCKHCKSQTVTKCDKCNIPLHAKCFKDFHVSK